MKKSLFTLLSLLLLFTACQEDAIDLRNDITGNYIGTIEKISWTANTVATENTNGEIQYKHIVSDTAIMLKKDEILISRVGDNAIKLNFKGQLRQYLEDYQNEFEWYPGNSFHETYSRKNNRHREGYLVTIDPNDNQLIFNFKIETIDEATQETKRLYLTFKGERQML